ncbi:MAG: type 4a pilus biogenesis protein PilO [Pseudomonadales bacterium]|nr:type 4a pilus biogenesis protein PilO [Candidatus Woesebacteria bacterium]MCB9802301.1 type 4a pilus biogenesis protein PilO [Pseudomonadales bacterium]
MAAAKKKIHYKLLLSRRRYLFTAVALLAGSALLIFVVAIPQANMAYEKQQQTTALRKEIAVLEKKRDQLQLVQQQTQEQSEVADAALPSKKPLLELLSSLRSAANQSGVTLSTFEVSPGELATASAQTKRSSQVEDYDALDLYVELEGDFTSIQSFLQIIEQFAPFTSFTKVTLQKKSNDQTANFRSAGVLRAELETRTYYFIKDVTTSVDTPLPEIASDQEEVLVKLDQLNRIVVPTQTQIEGGGSQDFFVVPGQNTGL